jgi:hypothetical protein
MEDILTERFQFATITPFKDYCRLDEKKKLFKSLNDDLDSLETTFNDWGVTEKKSKDTFVSAFDKLRIENKNHVGKIVSLPEKKKKKVFYASTTESIQEQFQLTYYTKKSRFGDNSFKTTKNRQIISHYGRPLSEITVTTIERSVRRHDDKITIKLYRHDKRRGFNCIYFNKSYMVQSITFNMVTGNFTTLTKTNRGKQNRQTFSTNNFQSIFNMIIGTSFITLKSKVIDESYRIYDEYQSSFNDELFTSKIQESLGIEDSSNTSYSTNPETFINDLMKIFVKRKKIKVPNGNYEYLLTKLYPTEKFLKKNDRKLVASVLDMLGIKTKSTIKILHEYPNIDIYGLTQFIHYFDGDYAKYIGNLNPSTFENSSRKSNSLNSYNDIGSKHYMLREGNKSYGLLDVEKENLIRIVNSFNFNNSDNVLSERFIQLVDDHLRMIERVREFDSTIHLKARTISEFNVEHRELSKIISAINKGWVIEYLYDEKVLSDLEKPLDCLKDENSLHVLYPYVLKREEDYAEEGTFMHHCVASYSDKDRSIIVSLRTESGMDRVTCEFDIQSGRCLQQRSFCNVNPPSHFEDGLLLLSQKIEQYSRWGTLNWKEKKKVPVKVNGIEITKELPVVRVTDIFTDILLPFQ